MNLPHGRILDCHSFNKYIPAAVWLNELRPQVMAVAENSFGYGHATFNHLYQQVTGFSLVRITILPAILGAPIPGPPGSSVCLPVKSSLSRNGNVLQLEGV